jgi:osmoprotectant transport system permease protein
MVRLPLLAVCVLLLLPYGPGYGQDRTIAVGSKAFSESYLIAEALAQLLEAHDFTVERRFGLGGTLISFEALRSGEIDVYPEYSGTIAEVILPSLGLASPADLGSLGLETLAALGFDNTYALAVRTQTAQSLGLRNISDLREHPELRFGLSHEFRDRGDGWPNLRQTYGLPQTSVGIEHGLAYRALADGSIDLTDAYSTDGELLRYDLRLLIDDAAFFPQYVALPLVRADLSPAVKDTLNLLTDALDEATMRRLNAEVVIQQRSFADVASEFLAQRGLISGARPPSDPRWPQLLRNTAVHLKLTGIALISASIVGLGIALLVYRQPRLARFILYVAGLIQTVPSIALLALLIPVAGIGQRPAIIALFLYSLLPIVRSAITALLTIDPLIRKVSIALGLTQVQQLRHVYLPLALPHVLTGLRIAAVVSIGTATLAAFIGAGGLGEPIVTGLSLNDTRMILQGAIPAALLAVLTELLFEGMERLLIPRHLLNQ